MQVGALAALSLSGYVRWPGSYPWLASRNDHKLGNPPQFDGWLFLANFDGEDSAIRGLHLSLAFFAASIQGFTTLRLSSSHALTPASGSAASLMSASIWLISSLL